MQININGEAREISSGTLAAALGELGYGDAIVATALNGKFVAASAREIKLSPGDKIEIVAPMQGG